LFFFAAQSNAVNNWHNDKKKTCLTQFYENNKNMCTPYQQEMYNGHKFAFPLQD